MKPLRLAGARSGQVLVVVVAACWVAAVFAQQPQPRAAAAAQPPTQEQVTFFESRIRPIFADNCYQCHSPAVGTPRGGLELDWKGGWEAGSNSGPVIVPGNPEQVSSSRRCVMRPVCRCRRVGSFRIHR